MSVQKRNADAQAQVDTARAMPGPAKATASDSKTDDDDVIGSSSGKPESHAGAPTTLPGYK
jgi:hypothetical protein